MASLRRSLLMQHLPWLPELLPMPATSLWTAQAFRAPSLFEALTGPPSGKLVAHWPPPAFPPSQPGSQPAPGVQGCCPEGGQTVLAPPQGSAHTSPPPQGSSPCCWALPSLSWLLSSGRDCMFPFPPPATPNSC